MIKDVFVLLMFKIFPDINKTQTRMLKQEGCFLRIGAGLKYDLLSRHGTQNFSRNNKSRSYTSRKHVFISDLEMRFLTVSSMCTCLPNSKFI